MFRFIFGTCICLNCVNIVLTIIDLAHPLVRVRIRDLHEKLKENQYDMITNLYLINKTNSITKEECYTLYPLYEKYHHLFEFIVKYYSHTDEDSDGLIKYKNLANLLLIRKEKEDNKNKNVLIHQEEQYCKEIQIYLKQYLSSTDDKKFLLRINGFTFFNKIYPALFFFIPTIFSPAIYFGLIYWTQNVIKKK